MAKLLAGTATVPTAYKVGLGNWTPNISDTYADIAGEPSGNGYARDSLTPGVDLTVTTPTYGDGYIITFSCTFTATGGNWTRVKQIHIGDDTTLMFTIPITSDMIDAAATLDWSDTDGLLIANGKTFTPKYLLYISNRNTASPKPVAYNTALDTDNPLTTDIIACYWMRPDANGQDCTTLTDVSGNDLHGTLSGLDPVAPVTVSGAGSTEYNQNYTPNSTEGGKTRYVSADGLYKIAYDDMGMNWWLAPIGSFTKMDGGGYYSGGENPWSSAWTTYIYGMYPGTAPAPTVAEGTAAAGPWTDDGLQFNGAGYIDLGNSAILNPQPEKPPIIVSGATGGSAVVNQNYTKTGTNVWTSADTNYKIMIDYKAWPTKWTICTSDYDPKWGKGTAYFHSSEDPYAASPADDTWTGVTVAQGSVTLAPGDPTGLTVHVVVKIGNALSQEAIFSRWGTGNAYILWRAGGSGAQYMEFSTAGVYHTMLDAVKVVVGEVHSYTGVWDGSYIRIYRDGVQVAAAKANDSMSSTSDRTCLGGALGVSPRAADNLSSDELRFAVAWKRPLTDAEIRSLDADPYQLAVP